MIFRRVKTHIEKENWFAVFVDFLIVVVGVFIGLQVANWNEARADERAYQNAMTRLAEESFITLDQLSQELSTIEEGIAGVQAAILVLETCETESSSEKALNDGLNITRGHSTPQVSTLALDQLVNDDRLLARQNTSIRTILREHHEQLHTMNEITVLVSATLSPQENDRHPLISFTGVLPASQSSNGIDVRRARINAPIEVVCKSNSFTKQFYGWERASVYQLWSGRRMEQKVKDTLKALELDRPSPQGKGAPG